MMTISAATVPAQPTSSAQRSLVRYFVFAYAITWLAWGAAGLTARGALALPVPDFAFLALGGLGPMLAAILVTARESGRAGVRALFGQLGRARVRPGWYLAALGLVPLLRLVPAGAHLATGGAWPADEVLGQLAALPFFFVFVALVGGGLDEELGWRGFALPRLQQLADPVRANLLLGGVWACWHLPLWLIPGTNQAAVPFPLYLVSTTALSFVLGAIYNGTRGSLLLAILAHAAANVADSLRATALSTADPARALALQVLLVAAMVAAAVAVVARTRGTLASERLAGEGAAPWRAPSTAPPAARRGGARRLGRGLGALALVALALAGGLLGAGGFARMRLRALHPPPGRLVDVGGYRLHLHCQGSGSPTVILEAGQGESSLTWAGLQGDAARVTRVCAYDRAGYGWSDRSPRPRTASVMVEELRALLVRAREPGPYVLVGHSLGGLNARLFAHRYPAEVAGLVLVDPSHEEMVSRLPAEYQGALRAMEARALAELRTPKLLGDLGLLALVPGVTAADARLPATARADVRATMAMDGRFFATLADEIRAGEQSRAELRAADVDSLGAVPLVVLQAGAPAASAPAGLPPWTPPYDLHAELAAQSSAGTLLVAAGSGHYVHYDQPALVLAAIRRILTEPRE